MFLHYLGEVKSSNLLRSATDILKNRIKFDKNETLKLPRNWKDTVTLAHYNICLEMSALRSHTRAKTSTPLFDCVVDRTLVQAFPFLNGALSQLVHILDFPAVNPLLKKPPYLVIDRVEVWTIWRFRRPKWRRDEVWCLELEQIDRLLCAVNIKLWRKFWRHRLQRILSTPHIVK